MLLWLEAVKGTNMGLMNGVCMVRGGGFVGKECVSLFGRLHEREKVSKSSSSLGLGFCISWLRALNKDDEKTYLIFFSYKCFQSNLSK